MEQKMSNKRIEELADFFYSSNNSDVVPLRIAVEIGYLNGNSLNKEKFIELMKILFKSKNLENDLLKFRKRLTKDKFNNGWIKVWSGGLIQSNLNELKIIYENK